ncbi:MAG: hypothetical protein WBV98_04380, partial [Candidatus Sulfotelmatobacter sp.]
MDVNEVTKQASLRDRFPGSRFHDVGASKKQSATSPNSLLTGKNTGNFDFPGPNNDAPSELLIYEEINMSRFCKSGVDPYLEKSS